MRLISVQIWERIRGTRMHAAESNEKGKPRRSKREKGGMEGDSPRMGNFPFGYRRHIKTRTVGKRGGNGMKKKGKAIQTRNKEFAPPHSENEEQRCTGNSQKQKQRAKIAGRRTSVGEGNRKRGKRTVIWGGRS